jgi:quercetin dioxygenase-like cupin family protein
MGSYKVVGSVETEECSLRLLRLFEGETVGRHHHNNTTQTYFVLEGVVEVEVGDTTKMLRPYEIQRVAPGITHGLRSIGEALVLSISIPPLQMDDQHISG